ncbi:MAG TPA: FIST N-terminal domain-containing protein [Acidimicrobiales bacterium]
MFAAALSQHPVPAQAAGHVAGELIERIGPSPDLVTVFVTAPLAGALDDIAAALWALLTPVAMVGAAASAVLADDRGVEDGPAVVAWAGRLGAPAESVRLSVASDSGDTVVTGLPSGAESATLLLIADPFSFPVEPWLADLRSSHAGLRVVGGLASAANRAGANRLVVDGRVVTDGAVGVLLEPGPTPVVAQGCRPIGRPFTVTKSERNVVYELGGRPAMDRLMEIVDELPPEDRALAARGLHCGIVADEHQLDFERGDFLIRNVLGADRSVGAVAVGGEVEVGTTVQFQVRDPGTAGDDLRLLLARQAPVGAGGALVFTCTGRGSHMFGDPHHDAAVTSEALGGAAVAGMFCAGELGPVAGRNALHGFTASVAVFAGPAGPTP